MDAQLSVESAANEAERLRRIIKSFRDNQVRAADHKQLIKATALSWFNNHRPIIVGRLGNDAVAIIDDQYRAIIAASAHATVRNRYLESLSTIKKELGHVQADHVIALATPTSVASAHTSDAPPDFSPLISDPKMQAILNRRWGECVVCVQRSAPLAATVMMGGLLEGLLLARINQFPDKSKIFGASSAPKDYKTGKPAQLKDWGLKDFINVAHELGWITKTARDVGEVVRDYRNFIHPQKEFSHGVTLEQADAKMLWEVAKSMTYQIVKP